MLKIWGRQSSSNVQSVLWCLDELKLDFERVDAGFTYGLVDSEEFRAMNPNGTVPVLRDGQDSAIWETGAILRYLAAVYGGDGFWPQEPAARAQVDKWAEWAKLNVAGKFTVPIFWQLVRTAPSQQDPVAIEKALKILNKFLKVADEQLGKQAFLAGDCLTLADIQFGHCLYRYFDMDMRRADFVHIERYYGQLTAREAFQKHVMFSYEELRVLD
ncbi:MAG: glutathione S-transferase family protein [Alphaproteobacteria bacterium]|nr:glutathione S-transferase family protein [Alphaproteobacteria bacterium]